MDLSDRQHYEDEPARLRHLIAGTLPWTGFPPRPGASHSQPQEFGGIEEVKNERWHEFARSLADTLEESTVE